MLRNLRFLLERLFRRQSLERDLDAEIASHLALETWQRIERGESPQTARQAALRQFGNVGLIAGVTRAMWGFSWLEQLMQDIRYAWRSSLRAPLFSVTVVLTLALGIGSSTAVFTLLSGILLRSLPFPESNRLAMIWELPPESKKPNVVSLNNFVVWKERSRSFQSMAAFYGAPMNLLDADMSEQIPGLKVTSEFFTALGVPPMLGRTFRPGEYGTDEPKEVVLSYAAWQQRFGASADVVGKRISIDASHHEIIGVMPPGFELPDEKAELYVPLRTRLDDGRNYSVIGRLRPGVDMATAKAEIAAIAAQTARDNVAMNAGWSATVVPLLEQAVGSARPVLLLLCAAVLVLLLLACANIANLLLMRSASRFREISLRMALGASRSRIVRQLLVENLLLAACGGLIGLAISAGSIRLVKTSLPQSLEIPRLHEVHLDSSVLLFSAALTVLSALIFGLAPALPSFQPNLNRDLHEAARSVTSRSKLRKALVIAEVALSVLLVTGAGLMARSFLRLSRVNAGFHVEHVLTVNMLLLPVRDEQMHAEVVRGMLDRIRALPGVVAAGSIGILPMQGTNSGSWYYRADRPDPPASGRPGGDISIITPGYFSALRIPIRRGRDFDLHDRRGSPLVAILNETAARQIFPGEDPIGKRIRVWWTDSLVVEVVGVAADIRHSQLNTPPDPCLFMPNDQQPFPFSSLVVRTNGDQIGLAKAIREQIHRIDADQGIARIEGLQQLVTDSIARPRFETAVLAAFASIALGLACIGLYGIIAYSVAQRTREIGIRVALGASHRSVFNMILGDGFRLTALGLLLGLAAALGLTRFLRSLLFEIQPQDPVTLTGVTGILTAVALFACLFPARRAMNTEPAVILREE